MKLILSFLLHAANRNIKSHGPDFRNGFYAIKDKILKKYGVWVGYDVQHIKGKKCNSCGGRGQHPKYGYNGKIYDYADCYHCFAGWYKMPLWICLRRVQMCGFTFHQPLKREYHIGNPFTKESLGWEVSTNPVIEGYIDHDNHQFGDMAIYVLMLIYNGPLAKEFLCKKIYWKRIRLRNKFRNALRWHDDDLPF